MAVLTGTRPTSKKVIHVPLLGDCSEVPRLLKAERPLRRVGGRCGTTDTALRMTQISCRATMSAVQSPLVNKRTLSVRQRTSDAFRSSQPRTTFMT